MKLLHAAKWEQFWKKCTEVVERVHSFIHSFIPFNKNRKVDEERTKSKIPHPNMYVEKGVLKEIETDIIKITGFTFLNLN